MSGCSQLHECSLPGSSVHGDSPGKKTGVGCHAAHSGSSQLRDWTQVSQIAGGLKNPGVGSLSLLQGIFPTRKSNWGLLHCRWILYQLSYQGSPNLCSRYTQNIDVCRFWGTEFASCSLCPRSKDCPFFHIRSLVTFSSPWVLCCARWVGVNTAGVYRAPLSCVVS